MRPINKEERTMGNKGINRRQFIRTTALGAVTAGLSAPLLRAETRQKVAAPKIVYRTLGRTQLEIPLISFGVMNSDSPDLIRKALDMGVNHLDTAHVYLQGNSERTIGEVLKGRGDRDEVYIATKMRFERDRERGVFVLTDGSRSPGATEENLTKQLDESLRRLQTDYVDILYLHNCSTAAMVTHEPMTKAFTKVKKQGKARFIGISTHQNEADCIRAAADAGIWDVALTAYNFLKENREEVKEANAYAAQKGVGIIAMKTQGGVRLNQEKKVQVNHAAALKWVLKDENVCTTIPGITTFEQMDLDFGVMADLKLSDQENRDLEISALLKGPFYCQNCRACIPSCPQRVRIPTLMRAYMYQEGYGNLYEARMTAADLPPAQGLGVCLDCPTCTAFCPKGIQIHRRLRSLLAMNRAEGRSA
jgi:predicted aldo/keto reductase-like oxidoreductase